jgi:hypothetical protein
VAHVNWLAFIASLVASLAWPAAAVTVAVVFRREIRDLLSRRGLHRVKAGPFEAEWNLAEQHVPRNLRVVAQTREPNSVESASAAISPRSAILERHDELVARLSEAVTDRLGVLPEDQSVSELIDLAHREGVINASTKDALVGLSVMRNLAAHGPDGVDAEKANEFLVLADAVEYAVNRGLKRTEEADEVDGET